MCSLEILAWSCLHTSFAAENFSVAKINVLLYEVNKYALKMFFVKEICIYTT